MLKHCCRTLCSTGASTSKETNIAIHCLGYHKHQSELTINVIILEEVIFFLMQDYPLYTIITHTIFKLSCVLKH